MERLVFWVFGRVNCHADLLFFWFGDCLVFFWFGDRLVFFLFEEGFIFLFEF